MNLRRKIVFVALLHGLMTHSTGCGRRSNYNLDSAETASSTAALSKGVSICDKSYCPKMPMTLDVDVAAPGEFAPKDYTLTLPAGVPTMLRLQARVADPGVMRAAALLLKNPIPWLTGAAGQEGSITVTATPPANSNTQADFLVRDMSFCTMKSKDPEACKNPSIPDESDKVVTLTIISRGAAGVQQASPNNLPPEQRCLQVPPETQQTANGFQQAVGIGSALMTGNFMPVITNITGGNKQNPRQGC